MARSMYKGYSVILAVVYMMFTVIFSVNNVATSNELTSICLQSQSHLSRICFESNITCSNAQKIKIQNITYYISDGIRNTCNSDCAGERKVLDIEVDDSRMLENLVHEKCSYKRSCQLNDSIHTPQGIGERIWFIYISYTCVSYDDVMDFCTSFEETVNDQLHIVTDQNTANVTCGCVVSENTNIVITEYRPCYKGICTQTDFYINGEKPFDCGHWCQNMTYSNIPRNTFDISTNVTISGVYPSMFLWLSISKTGKGNATVVCNEKDFNTIPTSTLNSESNSGGNKVEEEEDSHISIIPIVGGVVGSIVALTIVAVFIVYIKYIRRRKTAEQSTEGESHYHLPQFNRDSPHLVPGQGERSNNAYEMQDDTITGASGTTQANREGDNDSFEVHANEIKKTDDAVYSSEHYAKILDDSHEQNVANANVSYAKAGHYDVLQSNNRHTTYIHPQCRDNESEYDVTSTAMHPRQNPISYETLRDTDAYSHVNQTNNVNMARGVENYSHINVAQCSGDYSKIERVGNHQGSQCQDDYSHLTLSLGYN